MKVSLLVLATLILIMPEVFPDSVTLKTTGEVIQGDILSETDTHLVMMAVNYNRTITSHRTILKSDIAKIERDSTQQKVERRAYEDLEDRLRLDPNRELSKTEYESGIEAFTNYPKSYPQSKFVGEVQRRLALWQAELSEVEQGHVKFADKWMSPEDKKLKLLEKQLAYLQIQRVSLAASIEDAQRRLMTLQMKFDTVPAVIQGGGRFVANPVREILGAEIASFTWQLNSDRQKLISLDAAIQSSKSELQQVRQAYEVALAKSKLPSVQAAVAEPIPPPPSPPAAPPIPWIVRNWKRFVIGGEVLLVLLIPFCLLKYMLALSQRVGAEREGQRRAARAELKKVFDRILTDGERPVGNNTPDGKIIAIGKGQDANGGGRWFVVGESYIWAVQNNGRDGDNFVYNNVVTKGRGAIGARVPMDTELAEYIRSVANEAR